MTTKAVHRNHGRTIGQAYWNQVKAFLAHQGDAVMMEEETSYDMFTLEGGSSTTGIGGSSIGAGSASKSSGSVNTNTANAINQDSKGDPGFFSSSQQPPLSHIHTSLLQAAEWGNAEAQHYIAVAMNSGIWFTKRTQNGDDDDDNNHDDGDHENYNNNHRKKKKSLNSTSSSSIHQDFSSFSHDEALIRWHMAAMDGNLESLVVLGHRYLNHEERCDIALPFLESAAHVIIDTLEAHPHSRAKISPPMDRHMLPEIHMHGGTSSTLQWDNKPDESPDAIQYYHLLSTQSPDRPDVLAAYTLAHMYHYGLRGVPQNLTLAYRYYEIAAKADHGEAAGQAGKFHFWSLGRSWRERDLQQAHKFFLQGLPFELEKCRHQYESFLREKKQDSSLEQSNIIVCDHPSLNGMGLLHLFGIPMIMAQDTAKARAYFELAKDMGNMDASYNLAMMNLGHLTAWKDEVPVSSESLLLKKRQAEEKQKKRGEGAASSDDDGDDDDDDEASKSTIKTSPAKREILKAQQELISASNKGHIQARHRLGMLYSEGWTSPSTGEVVIAKDCMKAAGHYQWLIKNASPALSKRTRTAYKQYISGDLNGALLNYIMAAETGHILSQVNAAFLLERGVCLHNLLSKSECRQASLRYWKAAAQAGHAEAALRVGDFYYYGSRPAITWLDAILFPEVHLVKWLQKTFGRMRDQYGHWLGVQIEEGSSSSMTEPIKDEEDGLSQNTCPNNEMNEDGSCKNPDFNEEDDEENDAELEKAALYYRMAAQEHKSARANYNLGFMHEWGLGLVQDFPLAKRHYDLAGQSSQATLAVQLALWTMNLHERYDKLVQWWWGHYGKEGVVEG